MTFEHSVDELTWATDAGRQVSRKLAGVTRAHTHTRDHTHGVFAVNVNITQMCNLERRSPATLPGFLDPSVGGRIVRLESRDSRRGRKVEGDLVDRGRRTDFHQGTADAAVGTRPRGDGPQHVGQDGSLRPHRAAAYVLVLDLRDEKGV